MSCLSVWHQIQLCPTGGPVKDREQVKERMSGWQIDGNMSNVRKMTNMCVCERDSIYIYLPYMFSNP